MTGLSPPPELQVHVLRRAITSFPLDTGIGGDNTSPRAFDRLSDEVLMALCHLLVAIEVVGNWPNMMHRVLIVLLPNTDGGDDR